MDGPPQKRLKSASTEPDAPLPPGWTQHTAPTGHKYYYNKTTKKSTYTRPVPETTAASAPAPAATLPQRIQYQAPTAYHQGYQRPSYENAASAPGYTHNGSQPQPGGPGFTAPSSYHPPAAQPAFGGSFPAGPRAARPPPNNDRPKRKEVLSAMPPWILVYTRLGRRFVHNTETKASLWKFPADVMQAVIAHDQARLQEKHGGVRSRISDESRHAAKEEEEESAEKGDAVQTDLVDPEELAAHRARETARLAKEQEEDAALVAEVGAEGERVWVPPANATAAAAQQGGYDSSEYEEVEVTDSEGEEEEEDEEGKSQADAQPGDAPLEFDEDDIAFQLAALGEQYGLDPEEYGAGVASSGGEFDDDDDDGAAGLPMSDDERYAVFADMLTQHAISPYTPWETLVADDAPHPILHDDRFTVVQSARARKEAHARWCKEEATRIQAAKKAAQPTAADDPRRAFLEFVADRDREVRKLYWLEFRRKHKRESPLKATSRFPDRDMEKLYRELVACLKRDVDARERDLEDAVGAAVTGGADDAGAVVKADPRFWAVPAGRREIVLEAALAREANTGFAEDKESKAARAMRNRAERAEEERRQAEKARRYAKGQLRDSEGEIRSAMQVGRRAQVAD